MGAQAPKRVFLAGVDFDGSRDRAQALFEVLLGKLRVGEQLLGLSAVLVADELAERSNGSSGIAICPRA